MDAVNKLSKRKHYLNGQRELEKKVEWQREGDVCGFSSLEVVLLQYSSSMSQPSIANSDRCVCRLQIQEWKFIDAAQRSAEPR